MINDLMTKGERAIQKVLDECNIQYIYEYPLLIQEEREGKSYQRIWYPDFWLSEFGIVIEFFGMNNNNYKEGIEHKKQTYKKLHIDLIPVYQGTLDKDLKSYLLKTISRIINSKDKIFKEGLKRCYPKQ